MNEFNDYQVQMEPWGEQPRWRLLDAQGEPVPEAERFLHTLMLRGLAPRTRRTYAYDLLCAYRWMVQNDLRLEQISGEDMLGFAAYQQHPPPAAPSTINRRLRLLQRLARFHTGTTPRIPAWEHQAQPLHFHSRSRRGSLRLKEPHRVVHPLSDAQVREFVSSLKSWRDRLIVLLMWAEGLRSIEVLNLRLTDIDLHHGSLQIEGKGRKQRVMPLAEPVAKALLLYMRLERPRSCSPHLLLVLKGPHRARPLSPEGLRNIFRYHRRKSGIAEANPHRFRHSFGANMTRCRVPLLVLARMMGHSSPHTTMRYVEVEDQELREHFQQALDALTPRGLLDDRDL